MNTTLYKTEVEEVQKLVKELTDVEAKSVAPTLEFKSKDFMAIGGIVLGLIVATVVFLTIWLVK